MLSGGVIIKEEVIYQSEPGYETLGLSLQAAVAESFKLGDEVQVEIEHTAGLFSRLNQEKRLHDDRQAREPGLKVQVAAALCSGDSRRITDAQEKARSRAIAAVITGVAYTSVRAAIDEDIKAKKSRTKHTSSSTMERSNARKGLFANL